MADKKLGNNFCDFLSGELGPDNLSQCEGAGSHKVL